MHVPALVALALVAAAVLLISRLWDDHAPAGLPRARARPLLDDRARRLHASLCAAFPDHIVLAEVALTSLLQLRRRDRERHRRDAVDFVLLDAGYAVRAVVLVDDAAEAAGQALGEPARELLERAGYRVLALDAVPEVDALRQALAPAAP